MTAEQFSQLMRLIEKIADRQFTITQATDWQMLVALFGVLVVLIGLLWRDIGSKIRDIRAEDCKAHDTIWAAMKDCQDDCCPRWRQQNARPEQPAAIPQ